MASNIPKATSMQQWKKKTKTIFMIMKNKILLEACSSEFVDFVSASNLSSTEVNADRFLVHTATATATTTTTTEDNNKEEEQENKQQ